MKKILTAALFTALFVLSGCSTNNAPFSPGVLSDSRYDSKWISVSFLPEKADLKLTSQKKLEKIMKLNNRVERSDPKTGKKYMYNKSIDIYYDMHATGDIGEVLITADRFGNEEFIPVNYLTKKYIDPIKKRYADTDITFKITEDAEFEGRTYSMLDIKVALPEATINKRVYVAKIKDRVVNIAISYDNEEALEKLESCFMLLESE